jgi:hypothetical protein
MVAEHAERLATLRLQYALNAGGWGKEESGFTTKASFIPQK